MKKSILAVCLASILSFSACSGILPDSSKTKDYIDVIESEVVLYVGEKVELEVSTSFQEETLKWQSSDEGIAFIYDGCLVGVKKGEATITVKDATGEISDSVKITVKQRLLNISIDNTISELGVGSSAKIQVTFTPSNADNKQVTFASSDESIATVNEQGIVTGLKEGKVTITVKNEENNLVKTVEIQVIDGVEYDVCNTLLRTFLTSDRATSYALLSDYCDTDWKKSIFYDHQYLNLAWVSDGSEVYTVQISGNKDFETYTQIITSKNEIQKGTFIPGETYYVKVMGDTGIIFNQKIKIKDEPVRIVDVDGVGNVRDLGGWTTASGKKVSYGKIYRGAELEGSNGSAATLNGQRTMKEVLGIKTEIDMRLNNELTGLTRNSLGFDNYLLKQMYPYSWIIPENAEDLLYGTATYQAASATYIKDIFDCLADESNYPVYFHCVWGADRTGTLAFLINGLLGVEYDDLAKDFELTSFSHSGKRSAIVDKTDLNKSRNYADYTLQDLKDMGSSNLFRIYWQIMTHYGTESNTLSDAIANYLKTVCKVSDTTISKVKGIMLES